MLYILIILVICMGVHTYIGYIFYSAKDDDDSYRQLSPMSRAITAVGQKSRAQTAGGKIRPAEMFQVNLAMTRLNISLK